MHEKKEYNLFEIFMMLYFFAKRHFVKIFIFSLIGIILGTSFYFKKTDNTNISIIANSYIINSSLFDSMIDELQNTIELEDSKLLAEKLNISSKLSSQISNINSEISDKKEDDDYNYYVINLNTKLQKENTEAIDSIRISISNYFNTNNFILNKLSLQRKMYKNMILEINNQLVVLKNQNQNIVTNPQQNEQTFFNEAVALIENRNNIEEKLLYENALTIIDNYISKNKKTGIVHTLFKFFALFFIMGIFASIYIDFKRKVKKYTKN